MFWKRKYPKEEAPLSLYNNNRRLYQKEKLRKRDLIFYHLSNYCYFCGVIVLKSERWATHHPNDNKECELTNECNWNKFYEELAKVFLSHLSCHSRFHATNH